MRKVCAAILSAAICLAVSGAPAWASEHQSTLSAGYLHARTNAPGSDNLNGINVKYRYEFTDTLGLITSFSYANAEDEQKTHYSDTRWHEDSVRNRWFSVMAGPSVVQVDTNNNLNSMWAVKLQQMKDGRLYIAGIGAGIENTPAGMQSQVLLAADRIAMINPANGNTKPMFVGQGDQIFMNDVFLKRLTAPTITSGGNPPAFSLTPDGKLTAKNADISGSVNANAGTLNNVTINENCQIKGKLSANQIEGDIVKTVGKAFPRDSRAPERWPSGTITVRIYDDQPFDRQIVIPAVAFSGAKHERENNDIYSSCRLIVRKNGAEIYNRTALDNTLIYSGVIDMPAGRGHMTLEFSVSSWLVNDWYPTASISDLLVVVMKKATAGISIS
ncbi:Ail/Lom family outer membrane beta-barrel protein [Shigella sonnei]|nr:Host specificity protein J [Shigella sonnei]